MKTNYNYYTFEEVCVNLIKTKFNLKVTKEEIIKHNFQNTQECLSYYANIYYKIRGDK